MNCFNYSDAPFPIRADFSPAYQAFWEKLSTPGSWWTAEERIAIAQESRNALNCSYCAERKQALSPYNFPGTHEGSGLLPDRAVDAVHRIITDQSRITGAFVEDNAAHGLSKAAYVELVGIVVAVFSIDEFHRALGMPVEPFPEAQDGQPSGYEPPNLREDIGFVPTIPPDGTVGAEADLWPAGFTANVLRALTLVPDALRDWKDISAVQYLAMEKMPSFFNDDTRSINRLQMELVAGRVSAVNECFY